MQNSSLYSQIQAQAQQQQHPQFPEQEQLKCPRCDSANTKFCYYNNYNLSQPRHFCRNCKRYWTKGGALRNIPVGGGSRKSSKRSSSASADSAASKRPAVASDADATPSVSASKDKKDGDRDNAGEVFDTLPLRGENFSGQFESLSFSSLLGSGGDQYVGLLDGLGPSGSGLELNGHFGDPSPAPNVNPGLEIGGSGDGDEFLNLQGGGNGGEGGRGGGDGDGDGDTDSGGWGGGGGDWPDLSIYTPSSNFQ